MFGRESSENNTKIADDRQVLESIVKESFAEQKRARRWGVFFKSLTFAYLFIALWLFYPGRFDEAGAADKPHTGLIRIEGVIAADKPANANSVAVGMRAAFKNEHAKAVLLAINSPGGSPVQAGYIYDEIVRLRKEYPDKKLYAVIADLGASGGYYIAAAADEIYADKASLVGSIGVTASGFGFVGSLDKLGVERRHFTAGEHKAFLDPFSPLKQTEVEFWKGVLATTHQQFIEVVKRGRGDRLKLQEPADEQNLFSGLVWTGQQALDYGLVDGLGSAGYVAREIIGEEDIRDYTPKRSPLEVLTKQLGTAVGWGLAEALGVEARGVELK